jgi:hypothetical protein
MEYVSASRRWKIKGAKNPLEDLVKPLMNAIIEKLPSDALGHAKFYLEYEGGALFASSTLIPPELNTRHTGEYRGGDIVANVTLIFGDLEQDLISDVLLAARRELESTGLCTVEEVENGSS